MAKRTLTLAFLSPTPDDHWVNRFTGYVSKHPVCHVELFFESINQCFSIIWGEMASFRSKNLSSPHYQIISLGVTMKEYDACLQFCYSASNERLVFDNTGMWLSYFPVVCMQQGSIQRGQTFCSKIIAEALHFAGVSEIQHLSPSYSTPSRVYEALSHSPRRVCNSVPFKRHVLETQAIMR